MRGKHSYSAYTIFLKCPPAYRMAYIDGDPGITPPALKNGADVHDGIARYAAHCFGKKRKSDLEEGRKIALGYPDPVRELVETFVENWRWEFGSTIVEGVLPVEQEFRAMLPDGKTQFSSHLDLLQKYDGAATVAEVPFGEEGTGEGDEALWVVTDFKSGLYGDCWDELTAPKQLQWYCWNGQQNYPQAQSFKACLYSIRTNYTLEWSLGGDLSYIGHELQAIADRIAAETEWEPIIGSCMTCLHRLTCPCHETETLERVCGPGPEGHLKKLLWHKAQTAVENDILKEYVKQTGETVALDGKPLYGPSTPEPGVKVLDYAGLVALTTEADEVLRTPKSRLSGVARLLKPEKDVAHLLLNSPEYGERARALLSVNKVGKPRIGLLGNRNGNGNGAEPGETDE